MAWQMWTGCLMVGLGPGVVLYTRFVGQKSFLVLLSLASAFFWLLSLFFLAAIFRAFMPLESQIGPYAALVAVSVVVQEGLRILVHQGHKKMVLALNGMAGRMGVPELGDADDHELAISHGLGHGFAHSVFFFVSFLYLTTDGGTFYLATCPDVSFFVLSAIMSLAFLLLHGFGMMVFFHGIRRGHKSLVALIPTLHVTASLATLGNFAQGGCIAVIPSVLLLSVVPLATCASIVWQEAACGPGRRAYLQRDASQDGMAPAGPSR